MKKHDNETAFRVSTNHKNNETLDNVEKNSKVNNTKLASSIINGNGVTGLNGSVGFKNKSQVDKHDERNLFDDSPEILVEVVEGFSIKSADYLKKVDEVKMFLSKNCVKFDENSIPFPKTHFKYKVDPNRTVKSVNPLVKRIDKEIELSNKVINESKSLIERSLEIIKRSRKRISDNSNNLNI